MAAAGDLIERERELGTLRLLADEAAAGEGRLVVVEGPAGHRQEPPARGAPRARGGGRDDACSPRAAASSSASSASAWCASCSRPIVADPAARRPAAGAAAPAAAVLAPRRRATRAAPASRRCTASTGCRQPRRAPARSLLSVDDLHWSDRAVAALRGLPRAPARGPARCCWRAALRSGEPADDPALLASSSDSRRRRRRARRRSARPRVAEVLRGRLGVEPGAAFAAAVHRGTGGNPLLLRQLLARAGGRRACRPTTRTPARWRRSAPARSRAPSCCGSRAWMRGADAVARAVAILGESASYEASPS